MTTSIEKMTKRNEFETKMVLNGEPTKVSVDVIKEDGKYYVDCLVHSNHFDVVDVIDQIRLWASAFGVELPLEHISINYQEPAQTRDVMEDEFDLISDLCDFSD